jgi:hypothetical protein
LILISLKSYFFTFEFPDKKLLIINFSSGKIKRKMQPNNLILEDISHQKEPYDKCYVIFSEFKQGRVQNSERIPLLDLFIESMKEEYKKNGNNSSTSHLVSYIFQFLNHDEKEKLIPEFIKNSESYKPRSYKYILTYCTDVQKNQIILEKDCIKAALYLSYGESQGNYSKFVENLNTDPIFKSVINNIAPETIKNAFVEINQVFKGEKIDYSKSMEVEKSENWQITVSTMADHILTTPNQSQDSQKSFLELIKANISQYLSRG